MLKYQVATRTFYREDPLKASHPVKGTSVSMLAVDNNGPYLIGDSHVEWDEAKKKDVNPLTTFAHYENHRYSEGEATAVFEGKCNKLIADGYAFEAYPDMRHFMQTGEMRHEVVKHPSV